MQLDIKRAVLGGIAGTIVMSLMMKFVTPIMVGQPMDIAVLISRMLGSNYMIGVGIHLVVGALLFPVIYAVVAYRFLPGPNLVRGTVWGIILWLGAASMVIPMAGAGFFMSEIGGMKAAVAALIGHIVYGSMLGAIVGGVRKKPYNN